MNVGKYILNKWNQIIFSNDSCSWDARNSLYSINVSYDFQCEIIFKFPLQSSKKQWTKILFGLS